MTPKTLDIATIESTGEYRVLRRLGHVDSYNELDGAQRIGVVVDVETTGTNTETCKVIQLGLARFTYTEDGTVGRVLAASSFLDPGEPIPAHITTLTGITDADVRGKQIPHAWVNKHIESVSLCIAFHSAFDRPIVERYWNGFTRLPWACAYTDPDYRSCGRQPGTLGYMLMQYGAFHDAHDAENDVRATVHILAQPSGAGDGRTVLAHVLDAASRPTRKVLAWSSAFETKDTLSGRGYRWDAGQRVWWRYIRDADNADEMNWLAEYVYGRSNHHAESRIVAATDRFSVRG